MSDIDRIERMLRDVPAPVDVPEGLEAVARRAAVGDRAGEPAVVRPLRRPRWRIGRLVPAAAVMAAAAAATLVIGVGGRTEPEPFPFQSSLAMSGPNGAGATVDFGAASGGTRPLVLRVHGLAPAPAGKYYELWMRVSSDSVSVLTFNTRAAGDATIRAALASGMHWQRCWVTLERIGGAQERTVLRSV